MLCANSCHQTGKNGADYYSKNGHAVTVLLRFYHSAAISGSSSVISYL